MRRTRPSIARASALFALTLGLVGSPALVGGAWAQTVTRGPYLQKATPSSFVVRWRTDVATDSRVLYGTVQGSLGSSVTDGAVTTEHVVEVTGLAADTRYYYAIGTTSTVLAGDAPDYFVATHPTPGTPKTTRAWIIGDSGTANLFAQAVRDAYIAYNGATTTDLWLMLGDNAYSSGTDPEFQSAVFNTYPTLLRKIVLWPTLGNHDGASADSATQTGPYYDIFTLPKAAEAGGVPSGTEAYYSFDYG
ncbi:MAG: fibronectin type III domain-containing protein, partial [Myxococcales bacterium]|nr:fibronectin type III domain-containing protein [Myxococcales bacterium]